MRPAPRGVDMRCRWVYRPNSYQAILLPRLGCNPRAPIARRGVKPISLSPRHHQHESGRHTPEAPEIWLLGYRHFHDDEPERGVACVPQAVRSAGTIDHQMPLLDLELFVVELHSTST